MTYTLYLHIVQNARKKKSVQVNNSTCIIIMNIQAVAAMTHALKNDLRHFDAWYCYASEKTLGLLVHLNGCNLLF